MNRFARCGTLPSALTALLAFSLVVSLNLTGCSLSESKPSNGMVTLDPQSAAEALQQQVDNLSANRRELELRVHELVNVKRQENGLGTLEWEEPLSEIARYHSQDMADRNYFEHLSPEGEDFFARYKMFGYDSSNRVGNTVYYGAENLYLNSVFESYSFDKGTGQVTEYDFKTLEEIASSTVDGWMQSEGHRENMLMPYFLKEGLGVVVTQDGKVYITENFS